MNYEHYENEIVQRLRMDGVDISVLPHVGVLNDLLPIWKPQLFVFLNRGNLQAPQQVANPAQVETIQGDILIRTRERRGNGGSFDLYERITNLLMGFRPEGAVTGIIFDQFAYTAGGQYNWQYTLTFSFTAYRMPAEEPREYTLIKIIDTPINGK